MQHSRCHNLAPQGDSGGPFTVEESGQHQLAGVVSWGFGCAAVSIAELYWTLPALWNYIEEETLCRNTLFAISRC